MFLVLMASVDQMDVRNITEAAVGLDDLPQVCGIDTIYVENIYSGTDAVEKPPIIEKLVMFPTIDESVETV